MLPALSIHDATDRRLAHAKFAGDDGLVLAAPTSDQGHIDFAETSRQPLSFGLTALRYHVGNVFKLSSREQVRWVRAGGDVAPMEDRRSVRDRRDEFSIADPMGFPPVHGPVAVAIGSPCPQPAPSVRIVLNALKNFLSRSQVFQNALERPVHGIARPKSAVMALAKAAAVMLAVATRICANPHSFGGYANSDS